MALRKAGLLVAISLDAGLGMSKCSRWTGGPPLAQRTLPAAQRLPAQLFPWYLQVGTPESSSSPWCLWAAKTLLEELDGSAEVSGPKAELCLHPWSSIATCW